MRLVGSGVSYWIDGTLIWKSSWGKGLFAVFLMRSKNGVDSLFFINPLTFARAGA